MLHYHILEDTIYVFKRSKHRKAMLYSPPACLDSTTESHSDNEYRGKWMLFPWIVRPLVKHFVSHPQEYGGEYWDRTSRARGGEFTVHCITIDASSPKRTTVVHLFVESQY